MINFKKKNKNDGSTNASTITGTSATTISSKNSGASNNSSLGSSPGSVSSLLAIAAGKGAKGNNKNINKKHEAKSQAPGVFSSLFKVDGNSLGLKKKGALVLTAPISAAATSVARTEFIERYPIKEPYLYISVARDDIGSPVYIIEEPLMSKEEIVIYSRLMDTLQYELNAPYEGIDPRKYFDEQAKRIISKHAMSMGITPNVTWNKIYYYITRDMVGFGPLEAIMMDPNIEDVSIDGVNREAYVWHKKYESLKSNLVFPTEKELDDTIIRLVHMSGKHISTAFPIVDATMPGRHRLVATFRREVSKYGSTLTIRKFREDPFTIIDLLNFKTMNHEMAAYAWLLMEHNLSSIIVGATASGKTTLLNSITSLTRPSSKIVTIEETQEINVHHQNWVPLVSRLGYGSGIDKIGEVSLFDLVRASLRMRPDILIVGEVRGEEAYVLFQAISTGHGGMCTLHADDVEPAIQRLTSKPMDVAPSHIKFLDLMFVIRNTAVTDPVTNKTRRTRRVLNITEIIDYERYNRVFEWDPTTDKHNLVKGSFEKSVKLQQISKDTGKSMQELMDEIQRRKLILQWLQKKQIRNFREVGRVFEQYHERRLEYYEEIHGEMEEQQKEEGE
jgi:archaeal flagellar protein FlaI